MKHMTRKQFLDFRVESKSRLAAFIQKYTLAWKRHMGSRAMPTISWAKTWWMWNIRCWLVDLVGCLHVLRLGLIVKCAPPVTGGHEDVLQVCARDCSSPSHVIWDRERQR